MANKAPKLPSVHHKVDQRIVDFTKYYTDTKSPTYMNILQSGIKAGYSVEYSKNISVQKPSWFVALQEDVVALRAKLLAKSEQHFKEALETDFGTEDKDRLKIRHDTAKHISETLGKDAYSKRNELTDANGRRLFSNDKRESQTVALSELFKGIQAPS